MPPKWLLCVSCISYAWIYCEGLRDFNSSVCTSKLAFVLQVPLGEALFRPGTHRDGFVLMLKSCSVPFRALCLHVEEPSAAVTAGSSAAAAAAAAAATGQVGKELVLLGNTYDSFDQIIAVFCEPLRMNLEEIARHPVSTLACCE